MGILRAEAIVARPRIVASIRPGRVVIVLS
jgi:hypothetical protein